MPFEPKIPIAAITDEFSPTLAEALPVMQEIGMTGAELRVVNGRNIMDLDQSRTRRRQSALEDAGLPVVASLTAAEVRSAQWTGSRQSFQHDVFASKHTFEDQDRLAAHAFELAHYFGTRLIRVFSFWSTVDPQA